MTALAEELRVMVAYEAGQALIEQFTAAHQAMAEKYEAALKIFTDAKGQNTDPADAMVSAQHGGPTNPIDKLVTLLANRSQQRHRSTRSAALLLVSFSRHDASH